MTFWYILGIFNLKPQDSEVFIHFLELRAKSKPDKQFETKGVVTWSSC